MSTLPSFKPLIPWSLHGEVKEVDFSDQYWRSLHFLNLYRLIIGIGLLMASWGLQLTHFGSYDKTLFLYAGVALVICGGLSMVLIFYRFPGFNGQLTFQVISDIILFSIMIYASGGMQSGLGVLLLVSLAGAGLISRGRLALLFASLAALGVLLQETYAWLSIEYYVAQYSQAGLMSMAYFAVAWSAYWLARHTVMSEQLAKERGIDLANIAQVNQLIIQDLQEGILIIDKEGNIRQHNYCAEKLLGFNLSAAGTRLLKLSECAPELANQLENWHNDYAVSSNCLRLPITHALVRLRFLPIQTDCRNGVVIFMEDMDRVQAQLQQLKLAAVGRLTANIAHEIRNPLSAINHAAELLAEDQEENRIDSRLIRIICDNTQRLNKIVQEVLQLNRRNLTKLELINGNEFVEKFIAEFCQSERMDSHLLVLQAEGECIVRFDRDHLHQVLWNLCRNAFRHSRKQSGSVRIVLSKPQAENSTYLDIIDDGPGVDPQSAKQIFEPFFTTAIGGTGLGLYITRELCENNHASIDYVDQSPGGHFRIICKNKLGHE